MNVECLICGSSLVYCGDDTFKCIKCGVNYTTEDLKEILDSNLNSSLYILEDKLNEIAPNYFNGRVNRNRTAFNSLLIGRCYSLKLKKELDDSSKIAMIRFYADSLNLSKNNKDYLKCILEDFDLLSDCGYMSEELISILNLYLNDKLVEGGILDA